jgi:hypothetical protein
MASTEEKTKDIDQDQSDEAVAEKEPILCPHCKRTASNGIKCKGICVADDGY